LSAHLLLKADIAMPCAKISYGPAAAAVVVEYGCRHKVAGLV